MEHADGVLDGRFCGYALDGLNDNLLSLSVCVELGLVHDFVAVAGGVCAGLVLEAFHESSLCLFGAESGELFELFALLLLHLCELFLACLEHALLVVDACLHLLHLLFAAVHLILALVEAELALLQSVLALLDFLVALLHFFLQLRFFVEELLFYFEEFLFFDYFGFLIGSFNEFVELAGSHIPENQISTNGPDDESGHCSDDGYDHCFF